MLQVYESPTGKATFLCRNHGRKESVEVVGRAYNSYKDTADTRGAHFQVKSWDRKIRVSKDAPLPTERDSADSYENGSQETEEEKVSRKYFQNPKARYGHKYGRDVAGHALTWPCWKTENDAWSLYDHPRSWPQEILPVSEVKIGVHPWYTWWWTEPVDPPWRADSEHFSTIFFQEDIEHRKDYRPEGRITESASKGQKIQQRAAKRKIKEELSKAIEMAGKKIKAVLDPDNNPVEFDTSFRAQNGKIDETGTGFYHYDKDKSVVDHSKVAGYNEKLGLVQTVGKEMSREDFERFIDGYPALYLEVLRQGYPVQEYERTHGLPIGSLKDGFDRRLKEARKVIEHKDLGEPPELMDYFEKMSKEDYIAFVRRGGAYLFYRNKKIQNPLVCLGSSGPLGSKEDWEIKRSIASEYSRLLQTVTKKAGAKSLPAQRKVLERANKIWDSTSLFEWKPDPDYEYPSGNLTPSPCEPATVVDSEVYRQFRTQIPAPPIFMRG
jgi:hypothetical protein